jgi:ferrous-iron efflux pump FieF
VAVTLVALKLWALSQTGALTIAATLVDSALDLLMSAGGLVAISMPRSPRTRTTPSATARSRTWRR